ncbi:MAG: helix-turn-helix domain-containing protein [Acidobacteriota bacterium]
MAETIQLETSQFGARRLGVSHQRFYDLVRRGILPPGVVVRLGRHVRVHPLRLEEFIESGGAALPGGWKRNADGGRAA